MLIDHFFSQSVQTLDAVDGKQARQLNLSGPLGELFDHGMDSISTFLVSTSGTLIILIRSILLSLDCWKDQKTVAMTSLCGEEPLLLLRRVSEFLIGQ